MFDSAVTNWAIFGLILSILELFVPGVYLIWFGFAAFVVSLLVKIAKYLSSDQKSELFCALINECKSAYIFV